jgi:hypothetical protein
LVNFITGAFLWVIRKEVENLSLAVIRFMVIERKDYSAKG